LSQSRPAAEHTSGRKSLFAERLKAAMERRGWTSSETARQTASVLGGEAKFGRAHVWHYLHAKSLPRARQLFALSHALDVRPDELLRLAESRSRVDVLSGTLTGIIRAEDQGDGTVIVEVSQRVTWQTALDVMRLLKDRSSSDSDHLEHR
jgi:transcriptional regulator with XRE-family HTH domain